MFDLHPGSNFLADQEVIVTSPATTDQEMVDGIEASKQFREYVGPQTREDVASFVTDMFEKFGIAAYTIMDGGADHLIDVPQL